MPATIQDDNITQSKFQEHAVWLAAKTVLNRPIGWFCRMLWSLGKYWWAWCEPIDVSWGINLWLSLLREADSLSDDSSWCSSSWNTL